MRCGSSTINDVQGGLINKFKGQNKTFFKIIVSISKEENNKRYIVCQKNIMV